MKRKDMIFVFGSNLSGIHGAGAADYALKQRGAKWGAGEGLMGTCYALPTKGLNISFMSLGDVYESIQRFLKYADDNLNATFMVTQVGCGLGGFTKEEIAPLFGQSAKEGSNLRFDTEWKDLLPSTAQFWGTF